MEAKESSSEGAEPLKAQAKRRSVAGIVIEGSSLLLAKRKGGGAQGGRWEFIGGKAEEGEGLSQALAREFMEETGAKVVAGEVICSAEFEGKDGKATLYALSATLPKGFDLKGAFLPEHEEAAWFSFDEIPALNLVDSDRKLLEGIKEWIARRA